MSVFFDKALHFLGKTNKSTFVLNIGAMDGVMFDEMIGYTKMYNLKGLYVEPIDYLFERLKQNIGENGIFENSAISDYDGYIEMLTIDKNAIENKIIHDCFYGMSAVYPPKNGLGSEFDKPVVQKYGKKIKVPCITFETLLKKHKIDSFDVIKIDAEGHDYQIFKQINFLKHRPKIIRIEWINLSDLEKENILKIFETHNYKTEIEGQDIIGLPVELYDFLFLDKKTDSTTIVTGLWDIKRDTLKNNWCRSYDHYLSKLTELLQIENNMIIFGEKELENFIFKYRKKENTQFIIRDLNWFKNNEFFEKIQKIRNDEIWKNQVGWLKDSTQAQLEYYNPIVMSKMFLLHDAKILDQFNSEYMFWVDAGLTNTVHSGYFTHDKVLDKIKKIVSDFLFVCFPYDANTEVHGFNYEKLCDLANAKTNKVARGGFFGGRKDILSKINSIYYDLLKNTLEKDLMGTEESIFTLMVYKYPDLFEYAEIENNGLIGKFFEDVKNDNVKIKRESFIKNKTNTPEKPYTDKSALYVLTFNSPKQFETLIESFKLYDENFLNKTTKYLIDNSTDELTYKDYKILCEKYDFEHIKKDNLGICGGRQFIAEHFDKTDHDYMMFFEDDMFFYPKKGEICKNGFNRYVNDLYLKIMKIMSKENFDFLKFCFTEFYGDNSTQWSWYNVPQNKREEYWPEYSKLPEHGYDLNCPKTVFKNIKTLEGLAYATGEIYYCNWPQIVSKEGNKKMFLDTKWNHPFEQTWMSHIYQLTKENKINPSVLLLSPIEHNRFEHYSKDLRKES